MSKRIKFNDSEILTIRLLLPALIDGYVKNLILKDLSEEQVNNYQSTIDILRSLRAKFEVN